MRGIVVYQKAADAKRPLCQDMLACTSAAAVIDLKDDVSNKLMYENYGVSCLTPAFLEEAP